MSKDLKLPLNKKDDFSRRNLKLSQNEILELAVKVVVHPIYGWLTTALIIYGCRPIETFSLIPLSNGTATVIDFDKNPLMNLRRQVLANPFDFVEKLNICDQISRPVFYENFEDYNFDELNTIISNWNSWFKSITCNLELDDLSVYWEKRIIEDSISRKSPAE